MTEWELMLPVSAWFITPHSALFFWRARKREFCGFCSGIFARSILLRQDSASVDNWIPRFRRNMLSFIFKGLDTRKKNHFFPQRWIHYAVKKRRYPITPYHIVVCQTNGILCYYKFSPCKGLISDAPWWEVSALRPCISGYITTLH